MKIRKRLYTVLILLALAAFVPGFSQNPKSAEADDDEPMPTFKIVSEVNMVSVPVTVRKSDGSFFKGLTKSSFKILEDGKPQEIVFFTQEGLPTNVAMLLDISGSVQSEWGAIKYSTKRFLENLKPDDKFSLTTFNDEALLRVDWGRKIDLVDKKLSGIYCKGNTKLWDAIQLVCDELFKGIKDKKVIILISDGLDNQSYYSDSDALEAAVRAETAIYIVSKTESIRRYYEYVYPNGSVPHGMFAQADAVMRRLAYKTGGRVLYPNGFGQLDDIYAEVDEELRNQYTLGYISSNKAKDGSYREIDVGVSEKNVMITARPGYYAPSK